MPSRELLGDRLPEGHVAAAVLNDQLGDVGVLDAEAQVGLVVAVVAHRVVELHAREVGEACRMVGAAGVLLGQVDAERGLPHGSNQPFEHREEIILVDEAHLDVDLRELGLAIETAVLVAEAAHDLEVAVVAGAPSRAA